MKKLHYAWIVATVVFFVLLVGAGVRSTPGVMIVPLQREFGWSNATISAAIAVYAYAIDRKSVGIYYICLRSSDL